MTPFPYEGHLTALPSFISDCPFERQHVLSSGQSMTVQLSPLQNAALYVKSTSLPLRLERQEGASTGHLGEDIAGYAELQTNLFLSHLGS